MCAPSPPPAPDYAGAAVAQGAANVDAARTSAKLNNPNIISPYGTQTVTYDNPSQPDVGTVTQRFSPEQQALYDKEVQSKGLLGDLGIQGAQSLKGVVGTGVDFSGAPTLGSGSDTRQKAYEAMMRRVDEDTANQRDQANSDLIARGLHPGTKAYDDAQNLISRQYNDARSAAEIAAGNAAAQQQGMDVTSRNAYIAELLAQRQTPLNEINALLSGSQVSNPFVGGLGYQSGQNVGAAPIANAAPQQGAWNQNQYAQQVGSANAAMGGLFSLGAAAIPAFSDRRLKRNIKRIGTHILGIGIYAWDYVWGEHSIGVMADEVEKVMPEAVIIHSSGFKMVDYSMLEA